MAKSYEALIPVAVESGKPPVQPGETVELNETDAEVFLRRGFVKEIDTSGEADSYPDLSVTEDAGRERLIASGYTSDAEVRAASDEDLLAVSGIGEAKLEKIRAALA